MTELLEVGFWLAVFQIILIDLLLGADNAIVIALACRGLPQEQRRRGILYGTAGAIVLRIVLIVFALALLALPMLKLGGGLLLIWIGVKVLQPQEPDTQRAVGSSSKLLDAVKTVILADLVMSVDNVLAIAAAAGSTGRHEIPLVIFGLLVSIPVIVSGSQIVLRIMDRFPVIVSLGGMLLGWIAGQMIYTDVALRPYLPAAAGWQYVAAATGAVVVLAAGKLVGIRRPTADLPRGTSRP